MGAIEIRGNKTTGDLVREASWFVLHTGIAVMILVLMLAGMTMMHPDSESATPKLVGTGLAFAAPMLGGFLAAKIRKDTVATYIWISGLLLFLFVCVYVLDLPTGAGLCDGCGAVDKLWRTFFSINRNSGLMGGDGILIGTWIPLAMIGYAIGAKFGQTTQ